MRALFVIFSALMWVFTTSGAADAQTPVKYLDWPGKAHPQAAPVATPQAAPMVAPEPVAAPAPVAVVTPPAQTFAPKSIYDAPPPVAAANAATPAVAVVASAEPAPDRARRYSLHRDYSETPDRVTIPAPVYLDHLPVEDADKADKAGKQAKHDADKSGDDGDGDDDGAGGAF
jgi:hypothetical protein